MSRYGEGYETNYDVVLKYLQANPNADKDEIAKATGRKIHSPEMAKARKTLGIVWKRGKKAPEGTLSVSEVIQQGNPTGRRSPGRPRKTSRLVPVFQARTDGLYVGIIELAKLHGGINAVLQAASDVASV